MPIDYSWVVLELPKGCLRGVQGEFKVAVGCPWGIQRTSHE